MEHYRGAGLELAISNNFDRLLQGTLGLESELNKGTTFYCELPVSTKHQLE